MRREPTISASVCLAIALALPLWLAGGCGPTSSEKAQQRQVEQAVMAGGMTSDLRAEVTVPHLWASIVAMSPKDGKTAVHVHLERGGGLGLVTVSQSDMLRVMDQVALRTQDGDLVGAKSHDRWSSPTAPAALPQDYVAVPPEGLDLRLGPIGEGALAQWKSLASKPSALPAGTPLRYYLCAEVNCRSEDMKRSFYVPVLAVGLVEFSDKAE